jgi:hypothetical protein
MLQLRVGKTPDGKASPFRCLTVMENQSDAALECKFISSAHGFEKTGDRQFIRRYVLASDTEIRKSDRAFLAQGAQQRRDARNEQRSVDRTELFFGKSNRNFPRLCRSRRIDVANAAENIEGNVLDCHESEFAPERKAEGMPGAVLGIRSGFGLGISDLTHP